MEAENENGAKEEYFMLAHELPEDQSLREKLQKEKLVSGNTIWIFCMYGLWHSYFSTLESSTETAAERKKGWRILSLLPFLS